jgi:uncharacterized protein
MTLVYAALLVALFILGVVTGGLSNVTSGGAGLFTIFFLTSYIGLAIQDSTGTVLAASTVMVLVGGLSFLRRGQVNRQLALTVGLSGVLAAFVAARWAASIESDTLEEVFGAFTIALALYSASSLALEWKKRRASHPQTEGNLTSSVSGGLPPPDTRSTARARPPRWMGTDPASLAVQVSKGLFIGFATGFFGVGLGSLSIILFILLFRLDLKVILGTSLIASFMRYLGGSIGYLTNGLVDPLYFAILVAGGVVGSLVGARIILRSGQGTLDPYVKLLVIGILLFVGYEFLLSKVIA